MFPESPRWCRGRLWLSDMFVQRVFALDLSGRLDEIVRVPGRPSGLGPSYLFIQASHTSQDSAFDRSSAPFLPPTTRPFTGTRCEDHRNQAAGQFFPARGHGHDVSLACPSRTSDAFVTDYSSGRNFFAKTRRGWRSQTACVNGGRATLLFKTASCWRSSRFSKVGSRDYLATIQVAAGSASKPRREPPGFLVDLPNRNVPPSFLDILASILT